MIFESKSIQDYLFTVLDQRTQNNPRYSQRAFARDLKLSPGALSEILHGKRPITAKLIMKLGQALDLTQVEMNHLLSLLIENKDTELVPQKQKDLSMQLFRVISEWYHFAILNLMDIKKFRWDAEWISKKLGITFVQSRSAMKRLIDIEMVEKKGSQYIPVHDFVYSSEDVPSEAIRAYHREMLQQSIAALDSQPVDMRCIRGTGMAIKKSDLPKIKKEIANFHKKLLHKYSCTSGDYVYHYESALIRLSKESENGL